MYMPKSNINRYGRRKSYHEILRHICDIMVWNDSDLTENSSTPTEHVIRYVEIK